MEYRRKAIDGDLKSVRRQVSIKLSLEDVPLGTYICDFIAEHRDGTIEYVEAKGIAFPVWKQKWAILQAMHKNDTNILFTVVKN